MKKNFVQLLQIFHHCLQVNHLPITVTNNCFVYKPAQQNSRTAALAGSNIHSAVVAVL